MEDEGVDVTGITKLSLQDDKVEEVKELEVISQQEDTGPQKVTSFMNGSDDQKVTDHMNGLNDQTDESRHLNGLDHNQEEETRHLNGLDHNQKEQNYADYMEYNNEEEMMERDQYAPQYYGLRNFNFTLNTVSFYI